MKKIRENLYRIANLLCIESRQSCRHIETSQLICFANQLNGFYMMTTLVWFLYSDSYVVIWPGHDWIHTCWSGKKKRDNSQSTLHQSWRFTLSLIWFILCERFMIDRASLMLGNTTKKIVVSPNVWGGHFVERHSFRIVSGDSSKLGRSCVFLQNFNTRKLGEIMIVFIVFPDIILEIL